MATKPVLPPNAGLAATPRDFSRASENHVYAETLKTIAIFCGIGLVVSALRNPWLGDERRIFLNAFNGFQPRARGH
jgi:hypothetical protein